MERFILFLIYVVLMILVAEIIFWLSVATLIYTYIGYPLLLYILVGEKRYTYHSTDYKSVTIIISSYNEAALLNEKIANTLALNYPPGMLKVLVVTDGSTDDSPALVARYPDVQLLHEPIRRGKLAAMNRAVKAADSEILIFSDANTLLNPDCVYNMVRHFTDEKVGAVAGEKKIAGDSGVGGGEGAYWRYESFIKQLDSQLCSVVGAAGELFSIRRRLYVTLPENIIIEDFVQSMLVCKKGFVVRYEPDAFAMETASLTLSDERERKIRIAAGGFQAMACLRGLLNIFHYGLVSCQYISHRVLRWTACPLALITAFAAGGYLYIYSDSPVYSWLMLLQVLFYSAALAGLFVRSKIFYLPFYFCLMNWCVFAGFYRFISGKQTAIWQKAQRAGKI